MTSQWRIGELLWDRWRTQALASVVELGVCTELAGEPLTLAELRERLKLTANDRALGDYFDALVALGLLVRQADRYANTAESARFLDAAKPDTYVGNAVLEMLAKPEPPLAAALRGGDPVFGSGREFYDAMYATEDGVASVLRIMSAVSTGPGEAMAQRFPWQNYGSLVDAGCAEGAILTQIASVHPQLAVTGFDLPQARPAFEKYVAAAGIGDRARFVGGDFFADDLPKADVVLFGQVLHNWDLDHKRVLLRKAYDALPVGGAVVIYEVLVDDERRDNAMALFVSLSMNLNVGGGFDFTGAECRQWLAEAGFSESRVEHLDGARSMVVGIK